MAAGTLALVVPVGAANAALSPGDIAIIGYHGNGTTTSASSGDAFAWVPLVDLPAGEVIHFSDTGYFADTSANNGFGGVGDGTDGLISFTVPSEGIRFGEVQTVGSPINPTPTPYTQLGNAYLNASGVLDTSHLNLSTSGDQLIAFQDQDLSDTLGFTPLFAVNGASSVWSSGAAGDRNQTNLYPGLLAGTTAVALGSGSGAQSLHANARYRGVTAGTREQLLEEIANPANWDKTNGISETGSVAEWTTNGVQQYANGADPFRVLMVGNSYTQGTATARATSLDLRGFFDAAGINASVTSESFGGATLEDHAAPDSDAVAELVASAGDYDVIVLQERSDRPGRAMKFGGSQLDGLNAGGPVLIEDSIRVYQPQAEVVLFNTWARHPDLEPSGNDDLRTFFNDDPDEMQFFTNRGNDHIVTGSPEGDLADITSISRVGDAWQSWYEAVGYDDPSHTLHESDGTHQNDLGAYLSAAVLFESITQTSVVGNSYGGALADDQLALRLRVQAGLAGEGDLPGDFNRDGVVDAADYTVWRDDTESWFGAEGYAIWSMAYGATRPSALAVPEPYPFSLALAGMIAGLFRRRIGRTPTSDSLPDSSKLESTGRLSERNRTLTKCERSTRPGSVKLRRI